ncbi:WD40 repeat-like protein [Hortaea werneckii]|nr:WD40 repeat-like protein [Hortaea werneckii]
MSTIGGSENGNQRTLPPYLSNESSQGHGQDQSTARDRTYQHGESESSLRGRANPPHALPGGPRWSEWQGGLMPGRSARAHQRQQRRSEPLILSASPAGSTPSTHRPVERRNSATQKAFQQTGRGQSVASRESMTELETTRPLPSALANPAEDLALTMKANLANSEMSASGKSVSSQVLPRTCIKPPQRRRLTLPSLEPKLVRNGVQAASTPSSSPKTTYEVTTKGMMLIGTGPGRAPQPIQCQLSPALVDKAPDRPRVEGLNTARGAVDASSSKDGSGRTSLPASATPPKKSSRRHAICAKVEARSAGQAGPSPTSLILKSRHERGVRQSRSEAAAAAAVPQHRSIVADDAVARVTFQTYHMEATGTEVKAATGCTQDQTTSSWDTSLKPSATTPDQAPTSSKARLSTNERHSWCLSMNATSLPQNTSTPETLIPLASGPQTESTLRTEKAPSPICTTTLCHAESRQEAGPKASPTLKASCTAGSKDSATGRIAKGQMQSDGIILTQANLTSQTSLPRPRASDKDHLHQVSDLLELQTPKRRNCTSRTSGHGTKNTEKGTARTVCERKDLAIETKSEDIASSSHQAIESSPASPPRHDSGSDIDEDRYGYETPTTSPESSPSKVRPLAHRFPRLDRIIPQLDGARGSTEDPPFLEGPAPPAYARVCAEQDVQSTLKLLTHNEHSLAGTGLPSPGSRIGAADETPLVNASPAKHSTAFPFPRQLTSKLSSLTKQRQPSALLSFCERNATPRQRRMMTGGLRTPDRFISIRPRTPTKDNLARVRNTPGSSPLAGYVSHGSAEADPFAPPPRRSIRMAEQFATLRGPPPRPRDVGRSPTLVGTPSTLDQRSASDGAIWHVGGSIVTEGVASTTTGRGGRVTSGTSAPHYTADFLRKTSATEEEVRHSRRLALAMDLDRSPKILDHSSPPTRSSGTNSAPQSASGRVWRDSAWELEGPSSPTKTRPRKTKDVPLIPFRVLNAPALRDDYYCSLLAYSPTASCLAVGLGPHVYLWSESKGTSRSNIPDSLTAPYASHVTSISFSSVEGGSAILAIGRADGKITLWSPLDKDPRFDSEQPSPISCVCFRPNTVRRQSVREPCMTVATEELLVGDEEGHVYLYAVEWPTQNQRDLFNWHGSMTLLARITCHAQQICGLAWSPDGEFFASGGNDNQLFLFEMKKILKSADRPRGGESSAPVNVHNGDDVSGNAPVTGQGEVLNIVPGQERHVFTLNAAVKAIAFAPWQPSLIAAGGGSNDRCIHFFHTLSGAALATIDCHAQVTSLIWSEKRREIVATFGFAQPEHPYRVAVFTWPACRMAVGIPWYGEERALYAVSYPRGPAGGKKEGKQSGDAGRVDAEGRPWYGKRTREEGCLVVATSDASIKFHEIWPEKTEEKKSSSNSPGGWLGGSQILEGECSLEMERRSAIR